MEKNQNKKIISQKFIFPILLGAVLVFGFLLVPPQAEAAYQCSLGGSYADLTTCNANCSQTANCNLNPVSVSGSTGSANINTWLTTSGNRININYDNGDGATSAGNITLAGFTASGSTANAGALVTYYGTGNRICATGDNGDGPFDAGCITLSGATVSGSSGLLNTNIIITGSGNRICFSGDNGDGRFNAGCITITPTNYSCPLAGGSSCNASHQCTAAGTCSFVAGASCRARDVRDFGTGLPADVVLPEGCIISYTRGTQSSHSIAYTDWTCSAGSWINETLDGDVYWGPNTCYWSDFCGNSSFANCSLPPPTPINGICGYDSPNPYCPAGTFANLSQGYDGVNGYWEWNWQCLGINGGATVACLMYNWPTLTLSASSSSITQGSPVTLSWSTNYTRIYQPCTASGAWSGIKAASGSETLYPSATSSYTMTCFNQNGRSVARTVNVNVSAVPAPTLSFSASPSTITAGNNSTLSWTATNASSCTASGGWSGAKSTTSGSQSVTPGSTTSYTLQCWNSVNVSVTRIVTVTVNPPASCNLPWGGSIAHGATVTAYSTSSVACGSTCTSQIRTCNNGTLSGTYANQNCSVAACPLATASLSASPATIPRGSSSTLTWTTNNATSCYASNGNAGDGWNNTWKASTNGAHTFSVSPTATRTYSIECWNSDGVSTGIKNTTVTVTQPTVTFSASPTTITQGNASTLTWNVQNATSCWGDGTGFSNWQSSTNGAHTFTVYPPSTETFYIECWNVNGVSSGRKSVAITVNPLPSPTLAVTASPNPVVIGTSSTITWTPANVTSCTASGGLGGWSGSKAATGGNQSFNIPSNTTFSMECWNSVGTSTGIRSVNVTTTAAASCNLPWGGSIASGANVTAYQASSVPCGNSCVSQTRTCNNGVLSGIYINQNCSPVVCPIPTVTLNATSPIIAGNPSTLTWTTNNATSCYASDGNAGDGWNNTWKASSNGSHTASVSPVANTTYSIECWDSLGVSTGLKSASVAVNPVPAPTVTLTASPNPTAAPNSPTTLTWTTNNATSCTASGAWNGAKAFANGSHTESVSPASTTTYSIECWNGVISSGIQNLTVTVNCPPSYTYSCTHVGTTCNLPADCGLTLTDTAICSRQDSCGGPIESMPPFPSDCEAAGVSCSDTSVPCGSCSTGGSSWKEVSP